MKENSGFILPNSHEVGHVNLRLVATYKFDEGIIVHQRVGDSSKLSVHLGEGATEENDRPHVSEPSQTNLGRLALT